MPRLPTPVSRPELPRAVFTPASQGAEAARAQGELGETIGRAGQQIGGLIQQRQTQREVSQLNAKFAEANAELTVAWRETLRTADPNDDTVAETFRNDVIQPRLQALGQIANTRESREFFDRASSGLGASFLVSTEAGQQSLRETAAVQNWETSLNQMSDAVTADPFSFENSLAMVDIQVEGLVQANGLSRERALVLQTQARENLAIGAATGLISQDPDAGRDAVEAGVFSEFIDASQKQRLLNFADSQERAIEAARQKAVKQATELRQSEFIQAAVATDGTTNVEALPQLLGQVARDPLLQRDAAALRTTFNFLDQLADDAANNRTSKTDPQTFDNFLQRSLLPPGTAGRPTREQIYGTVGQGLSVADANFLVGRIDEEGSPRERVFNDLSNEAFRSARAFLTGSGDLSLVEDPNAIRNYQSFQFWATTEIERLRQEGKTPTEIFGPDGPIMSELPRFRRVLTPEEQSDILTGRAETDVITGERPDVDPFAFGADFAAPPAPALRGGPELGATINGRSIQDATPADMDQWLRENQ